MTEHDKSIARERIKTEGWNRYGLIDPIPSPLVWNKEVEILYEDMDGKPCQCRAIYQHIPFGVDFFLATNGDAKGNRMSNVFAWRSIKEEVEHE